MDKRKVISAYRRGLFSVKECGQLLGLDSFQLRIILDEESKDQEALKKFKSRQIK